MASGVAGCAALTALIGVLVNHRYHAGVLDKALDRLIRGHIGRYPGLPSTLAWVAVVFVLSVLCLNVQTRDSLLGRGKVLSLVSLGVLLAVLTITLVGWSLTM